MRVLVCTARQDMRKSFDTLAAVVSGQLNESPQSGTLYVLARLFRPNPRGCHFTHAYEKVVHLSLK